jgi:hypothetical protein
MKKLCFLEMEGVISSYKHYSPNTDKVTVFLDKLVSFCKKNNVELFLLSGHHESVAKKKLCENKFHEYFDESHFLCVDDQYISNKAEVDRKLHKDNLVKDPEFNDSFFKQVVIQNILRQKDVNERDALLLSNDIWVDGYYTIRFSKIDFAIFEDNITDRGKPAERVNGLAYFNLDFDSVKQLLEKFPITNTLALDKYVFEVMRNILVGDDVKNSIKNSVLKKAKLR